MWRHASRFAPEESVAPIKYLFGEYVVWCARRAYVWLVRGASCGTAALFLGWWHFDARGWRWRVTVVGGACVRWIDRALQWRSPGEGFGALPRRWLDGSVPWIRRQHDWVVEARESFRWNAHLRVGTWNVYTLLPASAPGVGGGAGVSVCGCGHRPADVLVRMVWRGCVVSRQNSSSTPNGGVLVGVHRRWARLNL